MSNMKKKRLTKKQLRVELRDRSGGWTNEWEGKKAKKLMINQKEYPVTLTDRLNVLEHHRKQLVKPILKGTGIKVKIDRDSLIQQEEAYDGNATVVSYIYKVPKRAQNALTRKTRSGERRRTGKDYFEYLRKKHGSEFITAYVKAEDEALAKTFGKTVVRDMGASVEILVDDLDEYVASYILRNEWRQGGIE